MLKPVALPSARFDLHKNDPRRVECKLRIRSLGFLTNVELALPVWAAPRKMGAASAIRFDRNLTEVSSGCNSSSVSLV